MRHSLVSRVFATVFSLWLGVSLVEPVPLHVCAMHGGLAIESQGAALSGTVSHGDTDHTASRHAMAGHNHNDQNTDQRSRQCSCLGDCATGASPNAVASTRISIGEAPLLETAAATPAVLVAPFVHRHFLLPFSNGPPVLSRS